MSGNGNDTGIAEAAEESVELNIKHVGHFNLKEGDVLVVRVDSLLSMYPFIEEIEKQMEEALSKLNHKVLVLITDSNTELTNDPNGVEMILAERIKQVKGKGYDAENDDWWELGQLAVAGSYYAAPTWKGKEPIIAGWGDFVAKKGEHDRIRQLTIAGALIAAEIDRLKRAAAWRKQMRNEHGVAAAGE